MLTVLPKFEVSISTPPFFRNDCEKITVNANYVYGEPVEGQLKVNMTVQGVGYSRTRFMDRGPIIVRDYTVRKVSVSSSFVPHACSDNVQWLDHSLFNIDCNFELTLILPLPPKRDVLVSECHLFSKITGSTRFTACLNELLPADLNPHFRGALAVYAEVTSQDGTKFTAYDDTVPISRHLVDIEFTGDTREHFKAGIPFKGKVRT